MSSAIEFDPRVPETYRGVQMDGKDRVAVELGLKAAPEGYQPPRWKRNKRGDIAHHYDCPRAKNGTPWYWPENTAKVATDLELLMVLPAWVRPCRACFHVGECDWLDTIRGQGQHSSGGESDG